MALSVNRWISSTGDFGAGGSWSKGVVPGATHVAVWDGASQKSVTTNLNASASACTQFLFKPQYFGNVGSPGAPLQLKTGAGVIVWRGRGTAYINPSVGGANNVICDCSPSGGDDLVLGGMGAALGRISMLAVKSGNVNCLGDVGFEDRIFIVGDRARLTLGPDLGHAASHPLNVFASQGSLDNWRPLQANKVLHVGNSARVIQRGILPNSINVVIDGNGRFQYLPTVATGTTPVLSVISGQYDMSDEVADNVWSTAVIGPSGDIKGGVLRSADVFPPSFDLREEYPGAQN